MLPFSKKKTDFARHANIILLFFLPGLRSYFESGGLTSDPEWGEGENTFFQ